MGPDRNTDPEAIQVAQSLGIDVRVQTGNYPRYLRYGKVGRYSIFLVYTELDTEDVVST